MLSAQGASQGDGGHAGVEANPEEDDPKCPAACRDAEKVCRKKEKRGSLSTDYVWVLRGSWEKTCGGCGSTTWGLNYVPKMCKPRCDAVCGAGDSPHDEPTLTKWMTTRHEACYKSRNNRKVGEPE